MRSRDVDTYSHRCSRWSDPRNMKRDGLQPHPARARGVAGGGQFTRGGGNEWMSVRKRADPESTVQIHTLKHTIPRTITKRLSEHSKLPRPSETRKERKKRVGGGVYPVGLRASFTPTDPATCQMPPRNRGEKGPHLACRYASLLLQVAQICPERIRKKKSRHFPIWTRRLSPPKKEGGRHVEDAIETRRRVSSITSQCSGSRGTRGEAQQPEVRKCTFRVCAGFEEFWDRATSDIDCIHTPDVHRPTACGRESLGLVRARNLQNHFLHLPPQILEAQLEIFRFKLRRPIRYLWTTCLTTTSPPHKFDAAINSTPTSSTFAANFPLKGVRFSIGPKLSSSSPSNLSARIQIDLIQVLAARCVSWRSKDKMNRDFKYLCNELSLRGHFRCRPSRIQVRMNRDAPFVSQFPSRLVNLTLLVLNDLLELFKVDSAGAQIGLFKISRVIIALSDARRTDLSAQPYEIILETIWVHVTSRPSTATYSTCRRARQPTPQLTRISTGTWLDCDGIEPASTRALVEIQLQICLDVVHARPRYRDDPRLTRDGGHARLNSGIQLQVWPRRRSRSSKILKRPSFDASASLAPTLLFSPAGPMVERLAAWVWNRFEVIVLNLNFEPSLINLPQRHEGFVRCWEVETRRYGSNCNGTSLTSGCGHTHHGLGLEGPKQWTFDLRYPYNFIQLQLVGLDSDFCGALTGRISALVLAGSRSSKFKFNTTSDSTPLTLVDASSLTVTVYSFNCVSELIVEIRPRLGSFCSFPTSLRYLTCTNLDCLNPPVRNLLSTPLAFLQPTRKRPRRRAAVTTQSKCLPRIEAATTRSCSGKMSLVNGRPRAVLHIDEGPADLRKYTIPTAVEWIREGQGRAGMRSHGCSEDRARAGREMREGGHSAQIRIKIIPVPKDENEGNTKTNRYK
ncbi:hypothetical protein C8R46DRAFT_1198375 [Mycena filopes]|nr:hypothetical protein C8R46DRAFT_1198375 [Mycena filopes]